MPVHRRLLLLALIFLAGIGQAQTITYPGCPNLAASDFSVTELAAGRQLSEPVAFDLQSIWNAAGDSVVQTNIFFVERLGNVKFYDGAAGTVKLAGTIPVLSNSPLKMVGGSDDNGLMGIALDPKYNQNRWLYVWYGPVPPNAQTNPRLRLSRFTVTAQNTLDMASEKILLDIMTSRGEHRHAGGPMTFDAHGDLWVTLGQSGNDINYPTQYSQWSPTDSGLNQEWGPSNTASLRGGIFRIHPDQDATTRRQDPSGIYGPGYTHPAGNFGEHWAARFQGQNKTALAAQYRDPAKVFPEVYVKGNRSPHSIAVHPTKQWLAWGEVNPTAVDDEINLVTHPVFAGHPYFFGNQVVVDYPNNAKNPAAPINNSPMNNGVAELPPAVPGALNGGVNVGNVAIVGPFYVYDRSLKNRDKLPPHFHNRFFHMSFSVNRIYVNTLDTIAATITRTDRLDNGLFAQVPMRNPLAARIGGDGALYVMNYDGYYNVRQPAVERVRYTGTCLLPPVPTAARGGAGAASPGVLLTPRGLEVDGPHALTLQDTQGRQLLRLDGRDGAAYALAELRERHRLPGGLAIVSVRTGRGLFSRKIVL